MTTFWLVLALLVGVVLIALSVVAYRSGDRARTYGNDGSAGAGLGAGGGWIGGDGGGGGGDGGGGGA